MDRTRSRGCTRYWLSNAWACPWPESPSSWPMPARLDAVLELQEQRLTRDSIRLARALMLLRAARAKLADGDALSIDDLANLTQEAVMTSKPDPQEIKTLTERYSRKHLTAEEMARLEHYAAKDAVADWEAVIAEAKMVMATGDPASPAAMAVARRWRDVVRRLT